MGFRVSTRQFPDVLQAGVVTGVVINQSRVTFSGVRGLVFVLWAASLEHRPQLSPP